MFSVCTDLLADLFLGISDKFVATRKELTNVQTNPEISATDS